MFIMRTIGDIHLPTQASTAGRAGGSICPPRDMSRDHMSQSRGVMNRDTVMLMVGALQPAWEHPPAPALAILSRMRAPESEPS